MTGNEQRRLCENCNIHVHNLSGMSGPQRDAFLAAVPEAAKQGPVCIHYEIRADGTMKTPSRWDVLTRPLKALILSSLDVMADRIGRRRRLRRGRAETRG